MTSPTTHKHSYLIGNETENERRTFWITLVTIVMMLIEIIVGYMTHSMALLAEGWHMATHAFAMGITLFAYIFSRRHANDPLFSFGTGKVNALGSFASAITLAFIGLIVIIESMTRLVKPQEIRFNEAILVAAIGLLINIACALTLREHPHHHHGEDEQEHYHRDHNLYAAYVHILTDAYTSVLAIIALFIAKLYSLPQLDSLIGIVGGVVIAYWAVGLLKQTGTILLDRSPGQGIERQVRTILEQSGNIVITDLHIWHISPYHYAMIISLHSDTPQRPDYYKGLISHLERLEHITVEIHKNNTSIA